MSEEGLSPVSGFEVLSGAYKLLQDKGICRAAYARDKNGETCGTFSPNADRFCVVGAVARSFRELTGEIETDLNPVLRLLSPYMDENAVTNWNDQASDEEILAVLRASLSVEQDRLVEVVKQEVAA